MIPRRILLFLVLCVWLNGNGLHPAIAATQEVFPFVGEITGDHVNVRAGQSANFEVLGQLNEGDEVIVVDKGYSWYKIRLPATAKSFVSKEYVQYLGQNAGGITADRVNIRAGAGVHFTALGQLSKGEQIFIRDILDEWYRIQPVADSYGWITGEYVTFKSSVVVESAAQVPDEVQSETNLPEDGQSKLSEGLDEEETGPFVTLEADDQGVFTVNGYVEPYDDKDNEGIHFLLIDRGRPVCYIQGVNHMLGRFIHQRVEIQGRVHQGLPSKDARPVIVVSKVKLML
jgi:uncharacterized protein YraI